MLGGVGIFLMGMLGFLRPHERGSYTRKEAQDNEAWRSDL